MLVDGLLMNCWLLDVIMDVGGVGRKGCLVVWKFVMAFFDT